MGKGQRRRVHFPKNQTYWGLYALLNQELKDRNVIFPLQMKTLQISSNGGKDWGGMSMGNTKNKYLPSL